MGTFVERKEETGLSTFSDLVKRLRELGKVQERGSEAECWRRVELRMSTGCPLESARLRTPREGQPGRGGGGNQIGMCEDLEATYVSFNRQVDK